MSHWKSRPFASSNQDGRILAEKKVPTCPDAIASWLANTVPDLGRVGMETGPLAVWLWNELHDKGLPIVSMDARHANAALKVRPNKTDRNDAAGLAQIVRTGWFKQVTIKSRSGYELRSLLTAREVLVRSRVKIENETRGCCAPSASCSENRLAASLGEWTRLSTANSMRHP